MRTFLFCGVCLLSLCLTADAGYGVQITEIMYHPEHGVNEPEDLRQEYIELYNNSHSSVSLEGWRMSQGVTYEFPSGTLLQPKHYLVVVADTTQFGTFASEGVVVVGGWAGKLSNQGESIALIDAAGNIMDEVTYYDEGDWSYRTLGSVDQGYAGWEWSSEHDGAGHSLALINPDRSNEYGQNWQASLGQGGTPGGANSVLSTEVAPFILQVSHDPIVPTSLDPVTVSAFVVNHSEASGTVEVFYRVDGSTRFDSRVMVDNATQGDQKSGDDIYSVTLPAQTHGTIVEFYIRATDQARHVRTWPAPTAPSAQQLTNALYQVDDTFDAHTAWIPGDPPVYYLIMTDTESRKLQGIWETSGSDAQMNGSFVSRDGTGIECRYCVSIRNRGNVRGVTPISFRVNFSHDDPWRHVIALNINSKYPYSQLMGCALFKLAGLAAPDATAVQLRVNGTNLAVLDSIMYGHYCAMEVLNSDFSDHHFPNDGNGNLYRLKDASNSGVPGLVYQGDNAQAYKDIYFKQTNGARDDWQDLIQLTHVLNHTPDEDLIDRVEEIVDLNQWVTFFAVDTLAGNLEGGLTSGRADDVALYQGMLDARFVFIPHDMDTLLGQGDLPPDPSRSVFTYTQVEGLKRLLNHPKFVRLYYQQLDDLISTLFKPAQFAPLAQRLLGRWVPQAKIDEIQSYVRGRNAGVLNQIEQDMAVVCDLPRVSNYFYTNLPWVTLHGTADAMRTGSVRVNGVSALWDPRDGAWVAGGGGLPAITLTPGINRIKVQAFDQDAGAGQAPQATYVDIWYDSGSSTQVTGTIAADTTWDAASGPWQLVGDVHVPAGITLTIMPGTTVLFDPNTALIVEGRLLAMGSLNATLRFTRPPGSIGNWNGIQVIDSMQDNQIIQAVIEYGRTPTGMVNIENSEAILDHLFFDHTDLIRLRLINSSVVLQNSVFTDIFPTGEIPSTDNESEQILGMGIHADGQMVIRDNVFGTTQGHNDVVDFTGPIRPGPIVQFLDNVFKGGGDELLDLGGDAYIEGNLFMQVHKDQYNVSSGHSNAISTGDDDTTGIIDVVRNIFYDVDHAVTLKNETFMFFEHNLVHRIPKDSMTGDLGYSVIDFAIPGRDRPGKGAYLSHNVFSDIPQRIFDHVDESQDGDPGFVTDLDMHYTLIESARASDRIGKQAQSILNLGLGNLAGDPRVVVGEALNEIRLGVGSQAWGTGLDGSDLGPFVPAGAHISNEPHAVTYRSDATLHVSGPGMTHYMYWVNDASASDVFSVDVPIQLQNLPQGDYAVHVVGRNAAGVWQDAEEPTVSKGWTVYAPESHLQINEILVINNVAVEYDGDYCPGLVELHNDGASVIDLSGHRLSDDQLQPSKYVFPKGMSFLPGAFLVVCADDNQTQPGIHLGFSMDEYGDSLYLFDPQGNLLDGVAFGLQVPNRSIGRVGHHREWTLTNPTFGMLNQGIELGDPKTLVINEWLAHSDIVFADDFIELYNPDPLPVMLGGLYLTDDPVSEPNKHEIAPLSFIPGSGYVVFISDGWAENGANHTDFRLSADQGMIGLCSADCHPLDRVIYGSQTLDVSQGRIPDGAEDMTFFDLPTPHAANIAQTTQTSTLSVIAIDDLWSYDDSGVDWGIEWRAPNFADSLFWATGQALLGGNVGGQALSEPVNSEMSTGATTFYFRKEFTLDVDPANVDALEISTILDDGAVFYLNGVEVLRLGMDGIMGQGDIYSDEYASRHVSRPSLEGPFIVSPDALRQGHNVMAVEVHQSEGDDAEDILFGMELDVTSTHIEQQDDQLQNKLALLQGLRMTEIMYHPIGGRDYEFVEIQNVGTHVLDMTGVRFTRGISFQFPETLLNPGEYLVVVSDMDQFQFRYGSEIRIAGEYEGKLSHGGESLLLQLPEPDKAAILRFNYNDTWFPETDGLGYSLVIQDPFAPAYRWGSSRGWRQSTDLNGSPGR